MVGLAVLSGLRRGERFALRWRDFDQANGSLAIREAVYEGMFDTPKTEAGLRQIPLSPASSQLIAHWTGHAKSTAPDALMFCTWSGKPIAPNNVLRRWVFPACDQIRGQAGDLANVPKNLFELGPTRRECRPKWSPS